jgi:hypothetical protein
MTADTPARGGRSRRGLLLVWMVAALCAVAYTGYWAWAARQMENAVREAATQVRGLVIGKVTVGGWPYRHTLKVATPGLETPDGLTASAQEIQFTAYAFSPMLWRLDHVDGLILGAPRGLRRTVATRGLQGSLRLSSAGLARLSLVLEGAQAAAARPDDRGWSLGPANFHLVADATDPSRYGLSLEAAQLRLSQEPEGPAAILGDTIETLVVRGPITQAHALATSASAWQAAGGGFEVMVGDLVWGPLQMRDTRARLVPDAQGRWQGRVATRGALVPQGVPFEGLSREVDAKVQDGRLIAYGLGLVTLPDAF